MKRLKRVQFKIKSILWNEAELKNTLIINNVYMLLKKYIDKTNSIHNTMKRLEDHGFIEMIGGHYTRNQKCKILITKDEYENYIMDFKKRPTVVKALCLHIAHDCNLACRYCFAVEGE